MSFQEKARAYWFDPNEREKRRLRIEELGIVTHDPLLSYDHRSYGRIGPFRATIQERTSTLKLSGEGKSFGSVNPAKVFLFKGRKSPFADSSITDADIELFQLHMKALEPKAG